jgi:hypothetical protein
MRENRQSGSEGREARQRAFLTPIGSSPTKLRMRSNRFLERLRVRADWHL